MPDVDVTIQLDDSNRSKLGGVISKKFVTYRNDYNATLIEYAKFKRQVDGEYDPATLKAIPKDKSKVYPKDTRVKIKAYTAKMMEMMFPASDTNFAVTASPVPNIPEEQLQTIIDSLQQAGDEAGKTVIDPETIDRAVREYAGDRAIKLETVIKDQLLEDDYVEKAKRAVRSGGKYGIGIVAGPMVDEREERRYEFNQETGKYTATTKDVYIPTFESRSPFTIYPDMAAVDWESQEGLFDKHTMSRSQFSALGERTDFESAPIKKYMKDNSGGNYTEESFESEIRSDDAKASGAGVDVNSRRYEVIRYVGFLSSHELDGVSGITPETLIEIWFFNKDVVKVAKLPIGGNVSDHYHAFIRDNDDDEATLLGTSITEELRDTQLSLAATTRMLMDNASSVAGPIYEMNASLLKPGETSKPVRGFQIFLRDDPYANTAGIPAIRQVKTSSEIDSMLKVLQYFSNRADIESNIPQWLTQGTTQGLGEAARTTSNLSMLTSGNNMIHKDEARNFDRFTKSIIRSLVAWNKIFGDVGNLGDEQVLAKGVTSLVSKEIRSTLLSNLSNILTEEERAMIDTVELLEERFKAADLPLDLILPRDEITAKRQAAATAASDTANLEAEEKQAKIGKTNADTEHKQVRSQVDAAKLPGQIEETQARVDKMIDDGARSDNAQFMAAVTELAGLVSQKGGTDEGTRPEIPAPATT